MDKIREDFLFTAGVCLDVDLGSQIRSLCGTAKKIGILGCENWCMRGAFNSLHFASLRFTSLQSASGPSFQRVCVGERSRGASGRKGPEDTLETTAQ